MLMPRLAAVVLAIQVVSCPVLAQAGSLPTNLAAARELPDVVQPLLATVVNISVLKPPGDRSRRPQERGHPRSRLRLGFRHRAGGVYRYQQACRGERLCRHGVLFRRVDVSRGGGRHQPAPRPGAPQDRGGKPIPFVKFGDSDALRVGEPVVAIGNPLGLSSSLSVGVVSALNRDVNMTMIDDFIQTDAAINHGNSGGPLFNLQGEVIGVNWAIIAPGQQTGSAGLGFAIPSNDAAWVVAEMRHFGRLHAGFIGFRLQQVMPDIQLALGLPSRTGGIVCGVLPGTPAGENGIQEGDVITAFNGHEPHDVRQLLRSLSASPPGSRITLQVWRDGKTKDIALTVAAWPNNLFDPAGQAAPPPEPIRKETPDLGLKMASADAAALEKSPFAKGQAAVSITGVVANSPAADLRLAKGNLILRVGMDRVATPDDVHVRLDKARAEGRKSVVMLLEAADGPHWVVMPLASD